MNDKKGVQNTTGKNENAGKKAGQSPAGGKKLEKGKGAKKAAVIAAAVSCGFLVSAAAAYTYLSLQYRDTFFPNTVINGLDASGKTVDQVKQMIDDGMESYTLILEERGGKEEQIHGEDIGLHPEYDGSLEQLLEEQEPLRWGLHLMEGSEHTIETMIAYDEEQLDKAVNGLECMDESKTELPKDAYLSSYQDGVGYEIIPEEGGTRVVPEKVRQSVADAIVNLKDSISLDEEGAYARAQITAENPELVAQAKKWNEWVNVTVAYHFGDHTEELNGDTIHTWMTEDEEGGLLLDEDKVAEYVDQLAKTYDTAYQPKTLKTAYGDTVTITGGNYGWRINRKAEAAALSEIIRSGKSQEREPVYSQTAASRGEKDYGNTYVEINLSAQHLYYYVDGQLLVESDFVSGNEARGMSTPAGAFPLTYKQRNATLRGQGYATPVSYWMPFNGGIGMHDASWRGSFGGRIYKTNGSHGCINLPASVAKTIYENISSGIPVLCYHLDGTNGGKTSSPTQKRTASAAPAAPAPTAPAAVPPVNPALTDGDPTAETVPGTGESLATPVTDGENPVTGEAGGSPSGETNIASEENPSVETPAAVPVEQPGTPTMQDSPSNVVVSDQGAGSNSGPGVQETPGTPSGQEGPGGQGDGNDSGVVEAPGA
ncbi:MAG: L,D-transpeptidase family protein [Lachnospiraceae bacterium]|jgi:hypothetical protein|nr:L,D-transpeptidase family protein [Lachnospiraceae bacterium]